MGKDFDKFFTKEWLHRKYIKVLKMCHSENLIWAQIEELYHTNTGRWLDWKHPKDINEKLMWLTRFDRNPLKTICADKLKVKQYLIDNGLGGLAIPLIGCWEKAEDVSFDTLPNEFVLKCNHGSGYNIICLDKNNLDFDKVKNKLSQWLSVDYSQLLYELHYADIPRRIIAEVLLDKNAPIEYQFWCVNGVPDSILVCRKNYDGSYDASSYSLKWERLYDRKNENYELFFSEPPVGVHILEDYARQLSAPFPFVRVDFYVVENKVYLAEMTFTPSANLLVNYKQSFLDRLGSKLILPKKAV